MTSKLNAGEIIVVDEIKLAEAKTKLMAKFLGNFETKNHHHAGAARPG